MYRERISGIRIETHHISAFFLLNYLFLSVRCALPLVECWDRIPVDVWSLDVEDVFG